MVGTPRRERCTVRATEKIVEAHLDCWNTTPGPRRSEAVVEIYSPDVFVGEPGGVLRGHDGVERAIDALHDRVPGAAIARTGPIQVSQDLVTYAWSLAPQDGPAAATGRDVLLVRDGSISHLYVVIDAP